MSKTFRVIPVMITMCLAGIVSAQDTPQSFDVMALSGDNKGKKVSLEELLPNKEFKEPTILMFVADTGGGPADEHVVKLAKLLSFVVKSYKDKKQARGAVIFLGNSEIKSDAEFAEQLVVPVAEVVDENKKKLEVYNISDAAPVTVVMWTKAAIEREKNVIVWTLDDLENKLDTKGQEMIVQFIGLL